MLYVCACWGIRVISDVVESQDILGIFIFLLCHAFGFWQRYSYLLLLDPPEYWRHLFLA
jgi:hypothetical protein